MREQLPLPFELPHGPRGYNLFFALLPDDDATARMAALAVRLQTEHGLKGRPLGTERLHVSLHSLGAFPHQPAQIITVAKSVGSAVEGRSFQIGFDRVLSFNRPGHAPLVLASGGELAGLMSFWGLLGAEIDKAISRDHKPSSFTPHLTLLYGDRLGRVIEIDPIVWTVREFVLLQSLLGKGRYIHLARWPLRD